MTQSNNYNHSKQIENLQEIGANLHRIRTDKGISLDEIAQKTAIAKRILVAIEQGEAEQLPEPVYTVALIKKYGSALGATEIPDYTAVSDSQTKPINRPLIWLNSFQLQSIHLYLLYILIVGISVRIITFNLAQQQQLYVNDTLVNSIPENKNFEVIESQSRLRRFKAEPALTVGQKSLDKITKPSQLVSQSNNEVTVDVELKDHCWMKVIVDGKVIFEGTLSAGTHHTWKGKKQVTIIADNAGGVVVTYNHGTEKLLGKPGQVQEVTYTVH